MKTGRRIFRILLWVGLGLLAIVLILAGVIAGWWQWQDYRGARLWADTERDLEARGESLNSATFIPPPIPDEQNLAFAPLFVRLYQYRVDRRTGVLTFNLDRDERSDIAQTVEALPYGSNEGSEALGPGWVNWTTGHALVLTTLQRHYLVRSDFPHAPVAQAPAEAVLLALTRFGPLLDELAQAAATRPQARFPVNWTQHLAAGIELPQEIFVQSTISALRLRACASLALGQNDVALRDVELGFRLEQAIAPEPTLISNLVDLTCVNLLLQPVWEGVAEHHWSGPQLSQLQEFLSGIDLLRTFKAATRFERAAFFVPFRDDLRKPNSGKELFESVYGHISIPPRFGLLAELVPYFPTGWFDEAESVVCRLEQRYVIDPVDVRAHRISARDMDAGIDVISRIPGKLNAFLVQFSVPTHLSVAHRVARMQAAVDEALTACVLERFYVDHQSYPASLDALVPAYLAHVPTDVIDGAPIRYRLTLDGRYRLWEVGWNGRDEDGKMAWNKFEPRLNDAEGDWVWQYEAVQPPTGK